MPSPARRPSFNDRDTELGSGFSFSVQTVGKIHSWISEFHRRWFWLTREDFSPYASHHCGFVFMLSAVTSTSL